MAYSLFHSFHSHYDIWQYSSANSTKRSKNDGLQQHSTSWLHFSWLRGSNKRGGSGNRCSRDSSPPYRLCFSYFRNFHWISVHNAKRHEDRLKRHWRTLEKNARLIHWHDYSSSQLNRYASVAGLLEQVLLPLYFDNTGCTLAITNSNRQHWNIRWLLWSNNKIHIPFEPSK